MRRAAALLMLAAAAPAPAAAPPARVMSISLCTDQLLLMLLPPSRIASVTTLARDTTSPAVAAAARRVPANRQSAEEVLRQHPDLVLADAFADPATTAMLTRLGMPLLIVPPANDFAAIRRVTRQVGAAVGATARAEQLVAAMDASLMSLTPLPRAPRLAPWDGSGALPPQGTLYDSVVTAAGARNIGREPARARGGFHVEALLAARPGYLLHDDKARRAPNRQAQLLGHPLVRRLYAGREIVVPQERFVCGSPATAEAAVALNAALRGAEGGR